MPERRGRFYSLNAPDRDAMILMLKRRGVSNEKIAKRVGISESGVRRALQRIAAGGYGEGMTRD